MHKYQLDRFLFTEYLQQGCRVSNDNHKPVSSSSSSYSSSSRDSAVSTTKLETTSKKSVIISPAPNIQNSVSDSGGSGRDKEQWAILGHTSGAGHFHSEHKHCLWIVFVYQLILVFSVVQCR